MIKKSFDNSALIKLYIDTGGTFTDCIAESPNGSTLKCKVLSSSAIRGTAQPTGELNTLHIESDFSLPNNFFEGYRFRLLSDPDNVVRITESNGMTSTIKTDRTVQITRNKTEPFEILSNEEAPVFAARLVTGTRLNEPLPPIEMRLATTKGTNALLERRGGNTLMLVTEGYKDLLKIRYQQRPELFSLDIQKPEPYYSHIIEVPERLNADGTVLKPIDIDQLRKRVEPFLKEIEAAGICLMHSYLNPEHEIAVENLLQELGVNRISRSSELSKTIRIVPRAIATDVNAFLSPVMERYLDRISEIIQGSSLRVMTSAGYLAEAGSYKPKDGLLSGPAGGVIGAVAIGKRVTKNLQGFTPKISDKTKLKSNSQKNLTGFTKIISFDMGGTSTDVARYDGRIETIYEHTVGDALISASAVDIETVAAGGGSICGFDGISLTVGPESAGADPGPACYGRGGPLSITDVNLLSGRLHPANFHISIMPEAAEDAFHKIEKEINNSREEPLSREQILDGFLDITNERMAQAIRKISIQKGFDPAEYALIAFGGAGAQHALAVAAKLGIETVLVPSDAGLLSAYGLQQAKLEEISTTQVLQSLNDIEKSLSEMFEKTKLEATEGLNNQGVPADRIRIESTQLSLRLKGQDTSLEIEWHENSDIKKQFEETYRKTYGHWLENREIEVEAIRVKVSEKSPPCQGGDTGVVRNAHQGNYRKDTNTYEHPSHRQQMQLSAYSPQGETGSPVGEIYLKEDLKPGTELTGPALILDPYSTTVIEEDWEGLLLEEGTWFFQNLGGLKESDQRSEAVNLQLYTNRFRSVADQMGEMLRRTSMSVNVKERLDYSCALLDSDGYLVVNAPHIPVHLGAMGTCVRALIERTLQGFKTLGGFELEEGDILITNHPAFGGSHLPDVTVVTPIFQNGKRIGFAASRAHHAEIGGKRPGSMPPDAKNLTEEGVVIPPMFLAKAGSYKWNEIEKLLKESRWPSRSPEENLADIRAAVAANHRGVTELKSLAEQFGTEEVLSYMKKLKEYAAGRMRVTLSNIKDGVYSAEEKLDDGSILKATCTVEGEEITPDFTGTSPVHPGNLNANPSIVNSVIIYLLRLMVDEPLPLNDGLLEPVRIIIPECMLNPEFPDDPEECPAVVGGNIETSQRLTDTLLKAFNLAACSYGTMNNVLFGNYRFGYYETVAGGTGAGDGFHGADAVHQHMTNTRAADPEILEQRYPVRLDRYAIRKNSGGNGKWNGGNGMIRELTFLEPVSLSVLAQHRVIPPYGLKGGDNGETGRHWLERKDGSVLRLDWRDGAELEAGDRFILHTPGGGGFGVR